MTILIAIPALCLLGIIALLFTSCSFNKYWVASDLPKPDHGFQTGTVAGYNVYVWDCFRNKHVVLYNETAEFRSGPYKREESACGVMTPTEEKLLPQSTRELNPNLFW
ncbi:MAG: hypothetical protein HY741_20445 [Chloroflexi bacterium]|nr:hypothetical protein [Chloroflexota bacterium]